MTSCLRRDLPSRMDTLLSVLIKLLTMISLGVIIIEDDETERIGEGQCG
jgi:hypothetical protein